MLEAGENPALCRNGNGLARSPNSYKKSSEQKHVAGSTLLLFGHQEDRAVAVAALQESPIQFDQAVSDAEKISYLDFEASLIDIDSFEPLERGRQQAAEHAAHILAENRQALMDGDHEHVPIPVDALGTARRLQAVEQRFGQSSAQYQELYKGLIIDCQRLIGEAYRKNTWEYFPKLTQRYDRQSGSYFSNGLSLHELVSKGLSPIAEPEEITNRKSEYVEEDTYARFHRVGRLGLAGTVSLITISECPEWALAAYRTEKHSAYGGYVPEANKYMIRSVSFDGSDLRQEEQLGVRGDYITPEVIRAVLADMACINPDQALSRAELRSKQFIDVLGSGPVALQQKLDMKASIISGKSIFMGELVADDYVKDYNYIMTEAAARQALLAEASVSLAEKLMSLQTAGSDRWAAERIIQADVSALLHSFALNNPNQAAIMYDEQTALGYLRVAFLESNGKYEEASLLLRSVRDNAPPVSYCGAGSCGLLAVSELSSDAAIAGKLGLKGNLLKDTNQACKNCYKKSLVYGGIKDAVCVACHSTNINGVITKSKNKSRSRLY